MLDNKYDPGFAKVITWDIPLLEGYPFTFVNNVATHPGSAHFKGIDNPELIKDVVAWRADAILVYGWSFKSHLKLLRYFKGRIPVFFRGDSTLLDDRQTGIQKLARKILLKWVYKHIDIALYTGTHNKAYFEKWGLKKEQLLWAPHAIDNERFAEVQDPEQVLAFRKQYNFPADHLMFLFAGKLEEKKDPFLLGTAFEMMLQYNCCLLFAGNGPLESALKQRFASNPDIHFCGFQNQSMMPVLYKACDVFVLPSKGPGETWGLALNEAMACNKPVIASDRCGGSVDLIKEGKNGYIFRAGSKEDLSRKMQVMNDSRSSLPQMGEQSGKLVQDFSLERIASVIEQTVLAKTLKKYV